MTCGTDLFVRALVSGIRKQLTAEYTAIWDYAAQPKEGSQACNLCGNLNHDFGVQKDRYGYVVNTKGCWVCNLVTINPHMTAEAYARFYNGPYRALVSAFHGREINAQTIQVEQRAYAASIGDFLTPHVHTGHKKLLDIGGSTGVVAKYLCNRFDLRGTVIDPSPAELRVAREKGLDTIPGSIEAYEIPEKWDVILLCQTVDHLLDIAGTLRKIKACMTEMGVFFVDIVDFDVTKELKIDHPFNLTESTMGRYLKQGGFHVEDRKRAEDGKHVRYVCTVA